MKETVEVDLDDPDPDKCFMRLSKGIESEIKIFKEEIVMISRLKRVFLRRKLKKEKLNLLSQVAAINKKLKILDEIDEKEKEIEKQ